MVDLRCCFRWSAVDNTGDCKLSGSQSSPGKSGEQSENGVKEDFKSPVACISQQKFTKAKRAASEIDIINTIKDKLASRIYGIPYVTEEKIIAVDTVSICRHGSIQTHIMMRYPTGTEGLSCDYSISQPRAWLPATASSWY